MRAAGLSICGTLAVLAGCVLPTPVPASALEPGVHLDPGSPAEKQYVLTLNQARQTGQGSSSASHAGASGSSSSGSSSQLFGSGIKPPKGGGAGGSQSAKATSGRGTQTGGSGGTGSNSSSGNASGSAAPTPAPLTLPTSVLRATRSQDAGGNGSLLALLGGGLAILVLGGFGGTVLRHSRRPTPSG
jgi:hypothetical protein